MNKIIILLLLCLVSCESIFLSEIEKKEIAEVKLKTILGLSVSYRDVSRGLVNQEGIRYSTKVETNLYEIESLDQFRNQTETYCLSVFRNQIILKEDKCQDNGKKVAEVESDDIIGVFLNRGLIRLTNGTSLAANKIHFVTQKKISSYDLYQKKDYILLQATTGKVFKEAGLTNFESLDIDYESDSSIFCHKVNKNCEDEVPNQCQRCRYGFYEVPSIKCSQGRSKICGRSRCGEKGQPACLRGSEWDDIPNECINGAKYGICQAGLETFCDENGVLICL